MSRGSFDASLWNICIGDTMTIRLAEVFPVPETTEGRAF